jgi:hypothetical protein
MLIDIVTNIVASQDDMDVVTGVNDSADLAEAAERSSADVIILTRNETLAGAGEYDELLYRRSRLKVIEISGTGRHGSLYELQPHRVPLGEMSPLRLLDAIRASAKSKGPRP